MAINGIKMVTDRSISDVEIAKSLIRKGLANMTESEKQQFLSGLKGAYNYTDFNRVESAVEYLAEMLTVVPESIERALEIHEVAPDELFDVPYTKEKYKNVKTKTDWTISDLLSQSDRKRYIDNIFLILKALGISVFDVPTRLENLSHAGANKIEQSLDNLNQSLIDFQTNKQELIWKTAVSWLYSGDLYGGEI